MYAISVFFCLLLELPSFLFFYNATMEARDKTVFPHRAQVHLNIRLENEFSHALVEV